jgi:hypothetical protein
VALLSEAAHESWTFHFENPSSYDTVELVPHFFEQAYDTDNVWLGGRLMHPAWSHRGVLTLAFTPRRTRRADDFDTFFQPDGNVVVTGTTGGASVRSWRIGERLTVARARAASLEFEYRYRRHQVWFHEGDGITTTTRPPSVSHRLVTTRESTVLELFQAAWSVHTGRRAAGGSFDATLDGTPLGLGRLTVDLPDKYPGRRLAFNARIGALGGRVTYTRRRAGWTWMLGIGAGRTFSWTERGRLDARVISIELGVIPR